MKKLIHQGKQEKLVRAAAVKLTQKLKQKDVWGEVVILSNFVRDKIRYIKDINGIETFHSAKLLLVQKAGDCDDKTILLASLLESIGHSTRLKAIGFSKNSFCHVYLEANINGVWIPLETTEPVSAGQEVKNYFSSIVL